MKSTLRSITVALLTACAVMGAGVWAADLEEAGLPVTGDGSLWARKSGTTNTKQDLLSTSNALHVYSTGSSATGTSAQQVQGTAASDAAVVGNPLHGGGRASSATPAAVSGDGDAVALWLTRSGATVVKPQPTAATIDTSFTAQTADFTVEAATASLRLKGWSIRESSAGGAAATVVLRHDADGTCDSTAVAAFIELSANQSLQQDYGPDGLAIPSGLCADVLAGEVDFVAYLKTEASL